MMVTVLGEFVLPSGSSPWTSTLLHVAGGLGLEEKSARQALARLAAGVGIVPRRSGRRARWGRTQPGAELLAARADGI